MRPAASPGPVEEAAWALLVRSDGQGLRLASPLPSAGTPDGGPLTGLQPRGSEASLWTWPPLAQDSQVHPSFPSTSSLPGAFPAEARRVLTSCVSGEAGQPPGLPPLSLRYRGQWARGAGPRKGGRALVHQGVGLQPRPALRCPGHRGHGRPGGWGWQGAARGGRGAPSGLAPSLGLVCPLPSLVQAQRGQGCKRGHTAAVRALRYPHGRRRREGRV